MSRSTNQCEIFVHVHTCTFMTRVVRLQRSTEGGSSRGRQAPWGGGESTASVHQYMSTKT